MLSRKSISLPLWRQIAAETALQSQNAHRISLAKDYLYCRRSNTQSIQLLALDFTFFMILSDGSIEWKRLKLNLRLCTEHLSICLSFAIKTSQTNMCNVTHLIETSIQFSIEHQGARLTIQTWGIWKHPVTLPSRRSSTRLSLEEKSKSY